MHKRLIAKGNVHKLDYLRTLVTDTMPGDIPIIVSNDGFYLNMKAKGAPHKNKHWLEVVDRILTPQKYTIPYRYNIAKTDGTPRRLSLTHPSSQIKVVDFYREFGDLICYYCRKSMFSIRSPKKVGSLFFVRGSIAERNKIKGASIDTVEIENSVSNPASYFSYSGYRRAYEFFSSYDYINLEKKYSVMYFSDISKCFNSIYTHTICWAISDISTAKNNTSVGGFGNYFDKLMQFMNYNETNGICVGSEVSRVFAEIILSDIDNSIIRDLLNKKKKNRVNYEIRRYVDDYYIFCDNENTGRVVLEVIQSNLNKYNLFLNEKKTTKVTRPFITKKSRIITDANIKLETFFDKFIDCKKIKGKRFFFPKQIRRQGALLISFLESVKSICFDQSAGYEDVSNYIISALASRVISLIDDSDICLNEDGVYINNYDSAIMLLLEEAYFFFSVNPTLPSSLRIAQAVIQASNFFSKVIPDRVTFLHEQVARWTFNFINSTKIINDNNEINSFPLEVLNIILILGQVGQEGQGCNLAHKAIYNYCCDIKEINYFEIVSFLFCIKNDADFFGLKEKLIDRSREIILGSNNIMMDSQAAHLALDIFSCPFIDVSIRVSLFNEVRKKLELGSLSKLDATAAINDFEQNPWFVNWGEASLLRLIRKKELSGVY